MSEWKELDVADIEHDFLVFNYAVEYLESGSWYPCYMRKDEILQSALYTNKIYRYRKPVPKAPTHEEIMTKWWNYKDDKCDDWYRVIHYNRTYNRYSLKAADGIDDWDCSKDWFTGRESADVPPEA